MAGAKPPADPPAPARPGTTSSCARRPCRSHRRVISGAGPAVAPAADDPQRVHAPVPDRGPDHAVGGPQQARLLRRRTGSRPAARGGPGRCQRISSASRLPIPAIRSWSMQPGLDRRGAPPRAARNWAGVISWASGPARLDRRVQPDAAQAPRVDQHEPAAVGEGQGEPGPAVVARAAAALPVVAAVDLGPVGVGDHDLARHPEVNAERDRLGPRRRPGTTCSCPAASRPTSSPPSSAWRISPGGAGGTRRCRSRRRP